MRSPAPRHCRGHEPEAACRGERQTLLAKVSRVRGRERLLVKPDTGGFGSAAPVRSLDQQTYRRPLMPAGITRHEGPLRRFRQRARSQSCVCCTLGPVVGDTIFLVGERPELAGSVSTASSQEPALGRCVALRWKSASWQGGEPTLPAKKRHSPHCLEADCEARSA